MKRAGRPRPRGIGVRSPARSPPPAPRLHLRTRTEGVREALPARPPARAAWAVRAAEAVGAKARPGAGGARTAGGGGAARGGLAPTTDRCLGCAGWGVPSRGAAQADGPHVVPDGGCDPAEERFFTDQDYFPRSKTFQAEAGQGDGGRHHSSLQRRRHWRGACKAPGPAR